MASSSLAVLALALFAAHLAPGAMGLSRLASNATQLRAHSDAGAAAAEAAAPDDGVCEGELCVMQNNMAGVCYEGKEEYISKCVRQASMFNRVFPDSAFFFTKHSDATCKDMGYTSSMERYSGPMYENVTGYAKTWALLLLMPSLEASIRDPETTMKWMTPALGYPAGCKFFGKVI